MANENPNRQPAVNPGKGPNEEFPGKAPDVYGQKDKADAQQQGQNQKPATQPQQGGQKDSQKDAGVKTDRQAQPDNSDKSGQHGAPNQKK